MQWQKWLSRKFIVSVIAQLASVAMLLWPGQTDLVTGLAQSLAALAVLVLSALGYVKTEGQLDWQALQRQMPPNPSG
jgi:hypothetical protein